MLPSTNRDATAPAPRAAVRSFTAPAEALGAISPAVGLCISAREKRAFGRLGANACAHFRCLAIELRPHVIIMDNFDAGLRWLPSGAGVKR
jgi:hypothetical protein